MQKESVTESIKQAESKEKTFITWLDKNKVHSKLAGNENSHKLQNNIR